jgi:hypothetical protein
VVITNESNRQIAQAHPPEEGNERRSELMPCENAKSVELQRSSSVELRLGARRPERVGRSRTVLDPESETRTLTDVGRSARAMLRRD